MKTSIRENRLIVYFANQDMKNIRQTLGRDLDWGYLFKRAREEGVLPLLYKIISESNIDRLMVPDNIWKRLESCYYTVAARNTLLSERLKEILSSFNQADIEVIILKGMALAQTIYNDIGLRPMYDIDILIHRDDLGLVKDKLNKLGYTNSSAYPEDFHKDSIMVDVHWELMNVTRVSCRRCVYSLDMDKIWEDARSIEIEGKKVKVLSIEHCLMELCLHLYFHHGLSGLIWSIDIAKVIEYYNNEIDWTKLIEDTNRYKIYRPVYYTLFYVKEILQTEFPGFVLDELKPKRQGKLEKKFFDLILSGTSIENIRFLFTLSAIENLFDKVRFLKEIILPSPKVMISRYNSQYSLCSYLMHFRSLSSSALRILKQLTFA
jgi:hypothetical protein